jgi:hypothetical protein
MTSPGRGRRGSGRLDPVTIAATVVLAALVPLWVRHLAPNPEPHDFFVDWTAARDVVLGRSLYRPLADDVAGLGIPGRFLAEYSTHPPTAAAIALPVAAFTYPTAFAVWNVASLVLLGHALLTIGRELG